MSDWKDVCGTSFIVGDYVCYTPKHGGRIQWGRVVGERKGFYESTAPVIRGASYSNGRARLHAVAAAINYYADGVWCVEKHLMPDAIAEVLRAAVVKE